MKEILGVLVLAVILAVPAMASSLLQTAPPPWVIAFSVADMTWADAKAFCQQQGGRLPLIGDSNSLTNGVPSSGTPIDGFGTVGGHWPVCLPGGPYWTGTEVIGSPGDSWVVVGQFTSGAIFVESDRQSNQNRVVCMP